MHRRNHNVCVRMGVALALAWGLLLTVAGRRTPACAIDPPQRPLSAPSLAADDLLARAAGAIEGSGTATLAVEEGELTALARRALASSGMDDLTVHITEQALYLGASAGRSRVPIRLAVVPTCAPGRLSMRVHCLTVRDRPLPRMAGVAIASALDALLEDAAWAPSIESVTLRDGTLVLTITRR